MLETTRKTESLNFEILKSPSGREPDKNKVHETRRLTHATRSRALILLFADVDSLLENIGRFASIQAIVVEKERGLEIAANASNSIQITRRGIK